MNTYEILELGEMDKSEGKGEIQNDNEIWKEHALYWRYMDYLKRPPQEICSDRKR